MKCCLLDTNVIIRFLTRDDPAQWKAADALFRQARSGSLRLVLDPAVLAEVAYVLESDRYGRTRAEIFEALLDLIGSAGVEVEDRGAMIDALVRFKERPFDIVDCWLAALAAARSWPVASFDHDFDKFKDLTRLEPKA